MYPGTRKAFKEMIKKDLGHLPAGWERLMMDYSKPIDCCEVPTKCDLFELAPLPKAVPCVNTFNIPSTECKQEGKTPMRYNDNYASASANVITVPSDTATQRDYLMNRLAQAEYPKQTELAKLFNIYVDNTPKTYKDLIDAIKNDKFSIDPKFAKRLEVSEEFDDESDYFWGPLVGIIWSGIQPDRDGFEEATKQKKNRYIAAKDAIMSGVYADGLKALQDFEAWLPVGKSN